MKCMIFTDADKYIGYGHLTRCTSLYDILAFKNEIFFIINGDISIKKIISQRNHFFEDWHENISKYINENTDCQLVIIDSYKITQSEINYLETLPIILLSIDDYLRLHYEKSIVLDWSVNVEHLGYHNHNKNSKNVLLLGTKYTILRDAFWAKSKFKVRKKISKILITLGGTDIRKLSYPLLHFLSLSYPSIIFSLVCGSSLNVKAEISNTKVYDFIDSYEFRQLMENTDLVITAGGQTLFELFSLGIPVIPIEVVDNQSQELKEWKGLKCIHSIFKWNDPELLSKIEEEIVYFNYRNRVRIHNILGTIIDSKGVYRVIDQIKSTYNLNI